MTAMPEQWSLLVGHLAQHQVEIGAAAVDLQLQIMLGLTLTRTVAGLEPHRALARIGAQQTGGMDPGLVTEVRGAGQLLQGQIQVLP